MTLTITKPEMEVKNGIYKFNWPDLKIHATLDRIISEGKTLSGELKLINDKPEGGRLIEQTRLNLLSDIKRNQLAKSLSERNSEIDWLNILKFICVMAVEDVRKGEPVEYLGGCPASMEQEYQLFPILEKNEPTTIFADGGTGKSYLADYIAVLIHYNIPGLTIPFYGPLMPHATNTLYLDYEATKRDHERRVWAIKQGLGVNFEDGDFFFYRRCYQPSPTITASK